MSNDRRIDYIEFNSPDVGHSKKFYTDVFGWTFTDYGPDYTSFADGRISGGFQTGPVTPGSTLVVLYSTQLERCREQVQEAGGSITKDIFSFPGGRRFHFTDPTGNVLAVWSE